MLLRVGGVAGAFPNMGTLSGMGLRMRRNRVRTLMNRGNTKGSALVGMLDNVCPCKACRNGVVCGNRVYGFGAVGSDRRGKVMVVRRRLTLVPCVAVNRGVCLNGRENGSFSVG